MFLPPPLDPLHPPQHPPRHLPRLHPLRQPTLHHPSPPANPPHRTHHRRRARPKRLEQAALVGCGRELGHGEFALQNLPALGGEAFAREREDRVARHAVEDRAVQRGRPELPGPGLAISHGREEVHRADLGDKLLLAEQPQVLLEAALGGLELGHDAGGVVGAEFAVADAAGPGAHGGGGGFEGDGAEAGGEVGAYGGGDEVEEGGAGGADAEGALGAD